MRDNKPSLGEAVGLLAPLLGHAPSLPPEVAARLRLALAEALVRLGRPLPSLPGAALRRRPCCCRHGVFLSVLEGLAPPRSRPGEGRADAMILGGPD